MQILKLSSAELAQVVLKIKAPFKKTFHFLFEEGGFWSVCTSDQEIVLLIKMHTVRADSNFTQARERGSEKTDRS